MIYPISNTHILVCIRVCCGLCGVVYSVASLLLLLLLFLSILFFFHLFFVSRTILHFSLKYYFCLLIFVQNLSFLSSSPIFCFYYFLSLSHLFLFTSSILSHQPPYPNPASLTPYYAAFLSPTLLLHFYVFKTNFLSLSLF